MMKRVQSIFFLVLGLSAQLLVAEPIKIEVVHFPDDVTNSMGMINSDIIKNELGIVDWNLATPSRYILKSELREADGNYFVILRTTREQISFDMGRDSTYAQNLAGVFNEGQVLRLIYRGDWNREFQKSVGVRFFDSKQNLLDFYMIDLESADVYLEDGGERTVPALNGKKLSSNFVRDNINSRF